MAPIALRLAAVTGARRSELAGLRLAAVDGAEIVFDRQIVVDREHPDAEPGAPVIREDATKTGARRRVTVDAETASLLDEARVGREELARGCSPTPTAHPTPTGSAGAPSFRRQDLELRVEHGTRRLPRRQREVLALRYLADLTEVATAQRLGCSLGTVKQHASRGLRTMRSLLDSSFEEPGGGNEAVGFHFEGTTGAESC